MAYFQTKLADIVNFSGGPWWPWNDICGGGNNGDFQMTRAAIPPFCNDFGAIGSASGRINSTTLLAEGYDEISILNLPVGFHVVSAIYAPQVSSGDPTRINVGISFSSGYSGVWPDVLTIDNPTILDIFGLNTFNHTFQLHASLLSGVRQGGIATTGTSLGPFIYGDFEILTYTWTIEGGPRGGPYGPAPGPFNIGDIIRVLSPDGLPDLSTINEFEFIFIVDDEIRSFTIDEFETHTPTLVEFELEGQIINPIIGGYTSGDPISTFGGSVKITNIELGIINPSGVYKLVTNKRNDTLYNDSAAGGETTDVKIPNPFIKTGFIGG